MAEAMYPGSFDPVTLGHVDIASRAASMFDKVTVAVYAMPSKSLLFSVDERIGMFRRAVEHLPNVDVIEFTGLAVGAARSIGAKAIVRGLRSGSDFEYEFEMAYINKKLAPGHRGHLHDGQSALPVRELESSQGGDPSRWRSGRPAPAPGYGYRKEAIGVPGLKAGTGKETQWIS